MISRFSSVTVISENMEEEQYSIPAISTTNILSYHPQHQYYSSSSPMINNIAANIDQMSDINGGVMSNTYCHQAYPRVVQGYQHSSTPTLDVDVDYEVRNDQVDNDYELLAALTNNHVENKEEEEEIVPWQAATDDVSSWEWPRFGGTLESIVDQVPCSVPIQHVPDHGNDVEEEEEKDDEQVVLLENQEYCHMVPQVVAEMKNTVVQSKQYSICNTDVMTVEEEDEHEKCYLTSYNSTPPPPPLPLPPSPSYHSQREERKIIEKHQMQRGKSSTTIPSSTNKRSKTIQSILHNKYERKRRGKINDRLETLQKLLPNFHKQTDKASMLDQVIEYVKKLKTQNDQIMNMRLGMFDNNNNNMPVAVHPMMMMPHYITTMQQQQQQQQQMSMMTQMGMGTSMNPADLVMMPTGSIVDPNMRHE